MIKSPNNNIISSNYSVKSTNSITFFFTNPTSLNDKMCSLRALIDTEKPHVFGVAETWFKPTSDVNVNSYTIYRQDRNIEEGRGGGVCIYVRQEVDSFEVSMPPLNCKNIEQVWCGLKYGLDKILVGCIYRPKPDTDVNNNIKIGRTSINFFIGYIFL